MAIIRLLPRQDRIPTGPMGRVSHVSEPGHATIPNDMNIFVDETTKLPRSIDETAIFVGDFLKKQREEEAAAA